MAENVGKVAKNDKKIRDFGNLYLGASFADLANFGHLQTISLVSRPKFAKNHKTTTATTSMVASGYALANPADCDSLHKSKCKNFVIARRFAIRRICFKKI